MKGYYYRQFTDMVYQKYYTKFYVYGQTIGAVVMVMNLKRFYYKMNLHFNFGFHMFNIQLGLCYQ